MVIQEMRGCALHWKNMNCRALLNKMTTIDQFKGSPQRRPLFFCSVIYLDEDMAAALESRQSAP